MQVLYVSKPIREPFHDGSSCLVRDVAMHLPSWRASVMGVRGHAPWPSDVAHPEVLPVYRAAGTFAPALTANARALVHLLRERRADVWHFVFAPNPRTSRVLRGLRRVRRVPSVQTIASPPRSFEHAAELLFGDVVVAQSEWTGRQLRAATSCEIALIRPPFPGVEVPERTAVEALRSGLGLDPETPVIVYPGDLEFSRGAERTAAIADGLASRMPGAVVVFACRRKTPRAQAIEDALRRRLDPNTTRFVGELPSLLPLLALAACVVFPVEDLYAKVDLPIAVLEASALGIPVIAPDSGPLAELHTEFRAPVDQPRDWIEAVVAAMIQTQTRERSISRQRAQLASEFDAKTAAATYEAIYERVARKLR